MANPLTASVIVSSRFALERRAGSGPLGSIWLARDIRAERWVTLRLADVPGLDTDAQLVRFWQEADAAAQIRSENVVEVIDHGDWNGVPFLVTEHLEGESLGERLTRLGRIAPTAALDILAQVSSAVAHAHALGMAHGDLKVENVFLAKRSDHELVKVLDFGIIHEAGERLVRATRRGDYLGQPYNFSPEQARGAAPDAASDIWALGVLAFACFTGRPPFEGASLGELVTRITAEPIPSLTSRCPDLPRSLDEWMTRALTRDPRRRFARAADFIDTLASALGTTRPSLAMPKRTSVPPSSSLSLQPGTQRMPSSDLNSSTSGKHSPVPSRPSQLRLLASASHRPAAPKAGRATLMGTGSSAPPGDSGEGSLPQTIPPPPGRPSFSHTMLGVGEGDLHEFERALLTEGSGAKTEDTAGTSPTTATTSGYAPAPSVAQSPAAQLPSNLGHTMLGMGAARPSQDAPSTPDQGSKPPSSAHRRETMRGAIGDAKTTNDRPSSAPSEAAGQRDASPEFARQRSFVPQAKTVMGMGAPPPASDPSAPFMPRMKTTLGLGGSSDRPAQQSGSHSQSSAGSVATTLEGAAGSPTAEGHVDTAPLPILAADRATAARIPPARGDEPDTNAEPAALLKDRSDPTSADTVAFDQAPDSVADFALRYGRPSRRKLLTRAVVGGVLLMASGLVIAALVQGGEASPSPGAEPSQPSAAAPATLAPAAIPKNIPPIPTLPPSPQGEPAATTSKSDIQSGSATSDTRRQPTASAARVAPTATRASTPRPIRAASPPSPPAQQRVPVTRSQRRRVPAEKDYGI